MKSVQEAIKFLTGYDVTDDFIESITEKPGTPSIRGVDEFRFHFKGKMFAAIEFSCYEDSFDMARPDDDPDFVPYDGGYEFFRLELWERDGQFAVHVFEASDTEMMIHDEVTHYFDIASLFRSLARLLEKAVNTTPNILEFLDISRLYERQQEDVSYDMEVLS